MSSSLQIIDGDLVLNNRAFSLVSGQDKLFQDLKLMIEEPLGTDPLAPNYGSALDGDWSGGVEISPYIGGTMNQVTLSEISSEVQRVLQQYQADQLSTIQTEGLQYQGRTSLTDDQIIYTIDSVSVSAVQDVVIVQVIITTLAGQTATLTFPVANGT